MPKIAGILATADISDTSRVTNYTGISYINTSVFIIHTGYLTTSPRDHAGFGPGVNTAATNMGYKSPDGKTIYWYSNDDADQFNGLSAVYYYFAIGRIHFCPGL